MSYTVTIPLEVVKATHRAGYWELYLHYLEEVRTPEVAYEMVEEALKSHGLPGRYKSYDSFRVSRLRMRDDLKKAKREHLLKYRKP